MAVVLAAVGPASADASRRGCKVPRGADVLARSKYAVVYDDSRGRDFGCLFSVGSRTELYDVDGHVTLAGKYVAYPQTSYDPDGTEYYLVAVRNLRSGGWRTLSPAYVAVSNGSHDGEDFALVTDLVLKKNGSVAWISCSPLESGPGGCSFRSEGVPLEVWRTDSRGTKRLAASVDVGRHSLTRRGSTIRWRDGSVVRHAQLR